MDRFVANLNIAHFRKQLAEETDETKRLMLVRLLAEEEAKSAGATQHPPTKAVLGLPPWPPVRRTHFDPLPGFRFGPPAKHATAWKHECMRTVTIDHGKFQIAVERRDGDRLPHQLIRLVKSWRIDLDHLQRSQFMRVVLGRRLMVRIPGGMAAFGAQLP